VNKSVLLDPLIASFSCSPGIDRRVRYGISDKRAEAVAEPAGSRGLEVESPNYPSPVKCGLGTRARRLRPRRIRHHRWRPHGRRVAVDAFRTSSAAATLSSPLAELGIAAQRVGAVADPAAVAKFGVRADGNLDASDTGVLAELANLAASRERDVPIAGLFRRDGVQEAYRALGQRHTRGKIVPRP
jgi:hypothetical protein